MLCVSLEHIEVFLVIFSETSETGHVAFPENWLIWHGMTHNQLISYSDLKVNLKLSLSLTLEVTNDNFHGVHRLELYIVTF